MPYEPYKWKDYPSEDTPVDADNLNHIEEGIEQLSEDSEEIKKTINKIIDLVYPIGSIYISVNNSNPSNIFGGIWEAFGAGKTLVGVDGSDEDLKKAESKSGNKKIRLKESQLPEHVHAYTPTGKIETTKEKGTISHNYSLFLNRAGTRKESFNESNMLDMRFVGRKHPTGTHVTTESELRSYYTGLGHTHTFKGEKNNTEKAGMTEEINIMPPYITCFFWKRIG